MLFFKKKEKINLICDLGLRSVGIAIVKESPKAEVLYSKRIYIPREEIKNHSENLEFSTKMIFEDLMNNGLKSLKTRGLNFSVEKMYCALNSPWYMAETRKIVIQKKDDFVVSQKIVNEEIGKKEVKFKEKIAKHFSKKIFHEGVQLLERTITNFLLNGYESQNPFQKKARSLELTAYMSAMPHSVFESVKKKAEKYFHLDEVVFTTFPLVVLQATQVLFQKEHDFIVVHVGAESTDISMVNKGSIDETATIPIGYSKMVDLVEEKFGASSDITFSLFSILSSSLANETTENTISLTISQEMENWKKEITALLKNWPHFSKRKIFLISEKEVEPLFKKPSKEAFIETAGEVFSIKQANTKDAITVGSRAVFDHNLFVAIIGFLNFHKKS